jgi:hypothetical protein
MQVKIKEFAVEMDVKSNEAPPQTDEVYRLARVV